MLFNHTPAVLFHGYYILHGTSFYPTLLSSKDEGNHHGTYSASRPTSLYRWLWARLKCRVSLFTQLCGAMAEQAQTMGPCSPLSEWGEEWRPLDMATWSLNASTSPSWEGHSETGKGEVRDKDEGKIERWGRTWQRKTECRYEEWYEEERSR